MIGLELEWSWLGRFFVSHNIFENPKEYSLKLKHVLAMAPKRNLLSNQIKFSKLESEEEKNSDGSSLLFGLDTSSMAVVACCFVSFCSGWPPL